MGIVKDIVRFIGIALLFVVALISRLLSVVRLIFPSSKKSVAEEIVLITGAGGGLGRGLALGFARLGATIVAWDINKVANDATVQMVQREGGKAHGFVCDCSKREDVYRVAQEVQSSVGHVTILINNAGVVTGQQLLNSPDDLIQKTMDINTTAHFWTTKAFLPNMAERNHGHVVSMASAAGLAGVSGMVDYSTSKFGAVGFADALRHELLTQKLNGVHVTCVCTAYVNTGMFPGAELKDVDTMEPDYVVQQTIDAVRRNQFWLVLPRSIAAITSFQGLIPTPVFDFVKSTLSMNGTMNGWVGSQTYQKNN